MLRITEYILQVNDSEGDYAFTYGTLIVCRTNDGTLHCSYRTCLFCIDITTSQAAQLLNRARHSLMSWERIVKTHRVVN